MRSNFILVLLSLVSYSAIAQIDQRVGEWESYLPYNSGRWVTQSEDKVYYNTDLSLFSINKDDVTDIMFRSKIDGLSETGINRIQYNEFTDQLIVVYDNSNIDILDDGDIINISDIKDNQVLTGDRSITDIHIFDETSVFFATAFGIVELNVEKLEFSTTIFTNFGINDLTSEETVLYAATDDGIYFVDVALYADIDDVLYFQGSDDQFAILDFEGFDDFEIKYLAPGVDRLLVGYQKGNFGRIIFVENDNSWKSGLSGCINRTNLHPRRSRSMDRIYQNQYSRIGRCQLPQ